MIAGLWRKFAEEMNFMSDKEKVAQIRELMENWKAQRDRFAAAQYQGDLTTIQHIVYSSHVAELEAILDS